MNVSMLADYLAQLPYTVGHQLGDQHVVVGAYDSDMHSVVHAAMDWNDGPGDDHETATQVTAHLASALHQYPVARLVVTAYGPDGPARSQALADTLEDALGVQPEQVHVHDNLGRLRNATTGGWGRAVPVAGVVARAALRGHPAPAASRVELLESVAPLPAALFGRLKDNRAALLRASSPLLRAEIAQRALDTLAASRIDDLEQMTVLSHLITTGLSTRDAALVHAISGDDQELMDARTSALVRTFRAAPSDQQPQLAAIAAASTFLAAWHAPIVHGLLRYADKEMELTSLVSQGIRMGVDPRPMRPVLTQATQELLAEAETTWSAQHPTAHAARRATSVPPTTPPRPPTHDPNATRPAPDTSTREL